MFQVLAQAAALAAAVLTYSPETAKFTVTFQPGAIWACTTFKSQTQTIEQGGKKVPYTPTKCYALPSELTSLKETWKNINCTYTEIGGGQTDCPSGDTYEVKVTIQYPNPPDANGVITAYDVVSNTLIIKH